jgi:hypothetical protein
VDIRVRARRDVQVAYCRYTVQAILERGESGRLWEEHEKTIETLVEMRVFLGLEQLNT